MEERIPPHKQRIRIIVSYHRAGKNTTTAAAEKTAAAETDYCFLLLEAVLQLSV